MLFLDENPNICATSTPISLVEHILKSIRKGYDLLMSSPTSFKRLSKGEIHSLDELIIHDIIYGKRNRDWIVAYYNTLASVFRRATGKVFEPIRADYLPTRNIDKFLTNKLDLHLPVRDSYYLELLEERREVYSQINDPILLSRTMLFDLKPTSDEFCMGVPDWFSSISNSNFVAFDPISKKHIKIEKYGKGYRYYTSSISDNWKEITDVPDEMSYIIGYLISNRSISFD